MDILCFSFSIYEKLIQFCGIDELGTNYPKDMFDPHGWSEDSYYEALGKLPGFLACYLVMTAQQLLLSVFFSFLLPAKAQKVEMDKLEKAKKERTKVRLNNKEKQITLLSGMFSFCVRGKSPPAAPNFFFTSFI